jgi:Fur family ferric uptake transcriptional regulator
MSNCSHERKNISLEMLNERVRKAGMKVTQQRTQVLQVLLSNTSPLTVDEIFKQLAPESDSADLVTIYRILKKFEDSLLVNRLEFGDGISRFELTLESGHHHHHVICRSCQKVETLHLCELDKQIKAVEALGYGQLSHRLDFFGLCKNCQ